MFDSHPAEWHVACVGETLAARSYPPVVVYPGAPLKAVAIEVTYAPVLDVGTRFAKFQRAHSEFDVLTPTSNSYGDRGTPRRHADETPLALLLNADNNRGVSVSRTLIAVIDYNYEGGYVDFIKWALPLVREALDALEPARLVGVTYRYENLIQLAESDDGHGVNLSTFFELGLPTSRDATPLLANVHLFWRRIWPEGSVLVSLDCCQDTHYEHAVQLVVAGELGDANLANLDRAVADAHRIGRQTFEDLITNDFRDHLRGTVK